MDYKKVESGRKSLGKRMWWNSIKEQRGLGSDGCIHADGSFSINRSHRAEDLAEDFSGEMQVPVPNKRVHEIYAVTHANLAHITVKRGDVNKLLRY